MILVKITQHPKYTQRFETFVVSEIGKIIIVDWKQLDARGIEI